MLRSRLGQSVAAVVGLFSVSPLLAATTFFGPTPYLSEADIPATFGCREPNQCRFVLENFEDGDATNLGFSFDRGNIVPPHAQSGIPDVTDSVDGDDHMLDGSGVWGWSYFYSYNDITVTMPFPVKAAALVWTDGERGSSAVFEAFDKDGNSLGTIGPFQHADNSYQGTTAEDRFYGVMNPDTLISRIHIRNIGGRGIEIDHVMYETCIPIPEPTGLAAIFGGLGALVLAYRRRWR